MSALGHYIEDEGIATTGISLVREHTAGHRPPRFLWVPFPLGRPFGAPHDPAFQREVLRGALELLMRRDGPVILEDFPRDAPATRATGDDDQEDWVCPVSFPPPPTRPDDLGSALETEVRALAPWYDVARKRLGRTTVGLTGAQPDAIAAFVAAFLEGTPPPLRDDVSLAENLKLACEDLKAYYQEAAMARPGPQDADAVSRWFWEGTAAAGLMLALAPQLSSHGDPELRLLARDFFIPRVQAHRL